MKTPIIANPGARASYGERELHIVNPEPPGKYARSRFVLWFGSYCTDYLLVWADSLEDALDECVDYLAEHMPGLLCDVEVSSAYTEGLKEGLSDDEAMDRAAVDTTCAGNRGNYLRSWEWGIALENPTRTQLLQLMNRKSNRKAG